MLTPQSRQLEHVQTRHRKSAGPHRRGARQAARAAGQCPGRSSRPWHRRRHGARIRPWPAGPSRSAGRTSRGPARTATAKASSPSPRSITPPSTARMSGPGVPAGSPDMVWIQFPVQRRGAKFRVTPAQAEATARRPGRAAVRAFGCGGGRLSRRSRRSPTRRPAAGMRCRRPARSDRRWSPAAGTRGSSGPGCWCRRGPRSPSPRRRRRSR
jgi:serine/arginine repetitive matrix protein 1